MLLRLLKYVMLIALLNYLLVNLIVLLLLFLLFEVKSTLILLADLIFLFLILQNKGPLLVRRCIVTVIFVFVVLLALVFIDGFWHDFVVLRLISAGLPSRPHILAHLSSIPQGPRLLLLLIDAIFEASSFNYLAALLIRDSLLNLFCWFLSIKGVANLIRGLGTRCVVCIRFVFFLAFIYYCRFVLATLWLPNFLYRTSEKVISYSLFYELRAAWLCFLNTDCLLLRGYYRQK